MLYGLAFILGVRIGFLQDAANGFEILISFTRNAMSKHGKKKVKGLFGKAYIGRFY